MNTNVESKNLIEISPEAIDELVRLNVSRDEFLRISLVSGGCSGLTYQLDTDTVQTPFDSILFENDQVNNPAASCGVCNR